VAGPILGQDGSMNSSGMNMETSKDPYRSWLFAPGNHARRVEKALSLDADAVILDLEDAVAVAEKPATRAVAVSALQGPRSGLGYIRVNAYDTPFCYGDLVAVVTAGVDGIVVPKVESADQLKSVDWLVGQLERDRGLAVGAIDIMPIIETGKGVAEVRAIAAAGTRTRRLSFGAGDYAKDMAMNWTRGESELAHARAEVALASRAAGLEAPIDTVWIHIKEVDGLEASAETVRDMGYQGKLCIHPDQVGVVNGVFTPTADAVAFAEKVVAAFDQAEAKGLASIQVDGYFVDYPIVDQARRTLALIGAIRAKG
jgi:citrate lyase subunit beta/citryl-CoA lyase